MSAEIQTRFVFVIKQPTPMIGERLSAIKERARQVVGGEIQMHVHFLNGDRKSLEHSPETFGTTSWATSFASEWGRYALPRLAGLLISFGIGAVYFVEGYDHEAAGVCHIVGIATGSRRVMFWDSKWSDNQRLPKRVVTELLKAVVLLPFSGFVTPSAQHARYSEFLGFGRPVFWPGWNGYPRDFARKYISPAPPPRLEDLKGKRLLLFPARFVEKKRPFVLLRSLEALAVSGKFRPPWVCVCVGRGPLLEQWKAEVANSPVNGRIVHFDRLSYPELLAFIASAEVMILPSEFEQWGNVVSEAILLGTPVVTGYRVGASAAVESGITGIVYNSDELEALEGSIGYYLGMDKKVKFDPAGSLVHRQYSVEEGARAFVEAATWR